jgi:hypothetical protein
MTHFYVLIQNDRNPLADDGWMTINGDPDTRNVTNHRARSTKDMVRAATA